MDSASENLHVSFNQTASCISVSSPNNISIYICEPFNKCLQIQLGGIGIVEMLCNSSLLALVGSGDNPAFSPRRLCMYNTKTSDAICDLNFCTAILAVRMNRQRLIVILERTIHILDIQTMQILESLDTISNSNAFAALSPSENGYLAFPNGAVCGEIVLYDSNNLSVMNAFQAHKSSFAAIAFNSQGTLLATASKAGTLIRVFSLPHGHKVYSFRRGSYAAVIYCLAFNPDCSVLCASSDTGTIHLFSLDCAGNKSQNVAPSSGMQGSEAIEALAWKGIDTVSAYLSPALTNIAEGTRDFAFAKLRNIGQNVCAVHGPEKESDLIRLYVATRNGYFYEYVLDVRIGGECKLKRENVLRDSMSEEMGAVYLKQVIKEEGRVIGGNTDEEIQKQATQDRNDQTQL